MATNQSTIDCTTVEIAGCCVLGHVINAFHGASVHGRCHSFYQVVWSKAREELQMRVYEGRFGAWSFSLPHGSSANPHVQRERGKTI